MKSMFLPGMHEPGGEYLMIQKPGWIVFTHGLGHDVNDKTGSDYRKWSGAGFGIIARLNHGYGSAGTIPAIQHHDAFSRRVANFVANSQGCDIWIIGNEPNHSQERPDGIPITYDLYSACFRLCYERIHALTLHSSDQVCIAGIAPWNDQTGDWITYFSKVLLLARPDAIALHTYTHGSNPALAYLETRMGSPYQNRRYDFRAYRDFLAAVPEGMRDLPVYITETDQIDSWNNVNSGWVQNIYKEIDEWNSMGFQQINALCLYRWPKYDKWYIEGKGGVYEDFKLAVSRGYSSRIETPEISQTWTETQLRAIIRQEIGK